MIDIFIPSYHRPENIKTIKYFKRLGYDTKKMHVFVDDETDDIDQYKKEVKKLDCNLHIFNMQESRDQFDYVHRASKSRRSAGQCRNMFYQFAKKLNIDFYLVIDDDTSNYQVHPFGVYFRAAIIDDVLNVFAGIKKFMLKQNIGLFGLSQTGDMFAKFNEKILRKKVMNTTFYNTKYIYRGERGIQDNDTSQFVGVMNEGYFTGSLASGLILSQTSSAKAKGGLTELYNECKLLNKSLVIPIQFPSLSYAEKQIKNGNRIHHRIKYRYLMPYVMKGKRNNIAWDAYPEDIPFTNKPKRKK